MLTFEDKFNISLPLAVYLCHDQYDHNEDPFTLSATTLLKPVREVILDLQNKSRDRTIDISVLIASRMGTSIHDGAEAAWNNQKALASALQAKSMSKILDRVVINPQDSVVYPDNMIPVYMENRSAKVVEGYTVTGKYDIVYNGVLSDYKSTTVWGYIFGSNVESYKMQGSIYRWLNPEKITKDYIEIQYIFTDWSGATAKRDKKYPQAKYVTEQYPLMSVEATNEWVTNKIREIKRLIGLAQVQLPRCTPEELWQKDAIFKYYKNPEKIARATKNFSKPDYADPKAAAQQFYADHGEVGRVIEVPAEVKRCKYCSVKEICDQAKILVEQGLAKLD